MTQVEFSETVRCPADFTAASIEVALKGHQASAGALRLELRVPSATLHASGLVDVTRAVTARLDAVTEADGRRRLAIRWAPEDGGPFPSFSGEFRVAESGPNTSVLTLAGAYQPPGGLAGEAFDLAVGHRMAEGAIRNLLAELREGCEHDYTARAADGSHFD